MLDLKWGQRLKAPKKQSYKILSFEHLYLLGIKTKKGHYRQIRAQISHIDCHIVGEEKYGSYFPYQKLQIALYARMVEIPEYLNGHPLTFKSEYYFFD